MKMRRPICWLRTRDRKKKLPASKRSFLTTHITWWVKEGKIYLNEAKLQVFESLDFSFEPLDKIGQMFQAHCSNPTPFRAAWMKATNQIRPWTLKEEGAVGCWQTRTRCWEGCRASLTPQVRETHVSHTSPGLPLSCRHDNPAKNSSRRYYWRHRAFLL